MPLRPFLHSPKSVIAMVSLVHQAASDFSLAILAQTLQAILHFAGAPSFIMGVEEFVGPRFRPASGTSGQSGVGGFALIQASKILLSTMRFPVWMDNLIIRTRKYHTLQALVIPPSIVIVCPVM